METIFFDEVSAIRLSGVYTSTEVLRQFVNMLASLRERYSPYVEIV